MAAYAGPAPWYQGVSETYKNGRRKSRLVSGNQEWNLSEGWHAKRQAGWYNKPSKRKGQTVTKQTLIGLHGEDIEVYDSKGYKDEIGFNARNSEDAEAYASNALDGPNPGPIEDVKIDKGHIKRIEYASREQVMRVTFWNDAKVIYFRVPTTCAGMLLHFANDNYEVAPNKETGRPRHVLGVAFWNYIRIRGQAHGSRYPFQYEQHGVYKLTGSNKLYRVKLTEENFEKILGRKYNGTLKPGDVIETALSEEQYGIYDEARTLDDDNTRSINGNKVTAMEYDKASGIGRQIDAVQSAEDDFFDKLDKELRSNRQAAQAELAKKDPLTKEELDEFRSLIAELETGRNKARENLYGKRKEPAEAFDIWKSNHAKEYADLLRQEDEHELRKGQAEKIARRKAALDFYAGETEGADIDRLADRIRRSAQITDEDKMRGYKGLNDEKLYGRASKILEDKYGRYVELMRKYAAPHFANNMSRRVWTKDDLYRMTDPVIMPDNNQRAIYKTYLATEDWNGALNFLKNHQGPAQRWNQQTGKLITYNKKSETYAGNSDILDI